MRVNLNKPISSSGTLLLLATGRTGLTGMKWNEDRTRLIEPGKMPTTIEVIKGDITIAGLIDAKSVFVESLDGNGNPMKTISRSVKNGAVTLDIGKDVTVWYYLTVMR